MQLIADICAVGVVLPGQGGEAAVFRGAAISGRVAAEMGVGIGQEDIGEVLWSIMVSDEF
jgi:hypothetical protein